MAPIFKYAISALCVFAASPVLAAPVQGSLALARRQLAGEGAASNSILSSTDNGVGYGAENAEDNIAGNINTVKASVPAVPGTRRQLDKVVNGAGNVATAAGAGQVGGQAAQAADTVDGDTTSDAATAGAQVGSVEETTLENAGSDVP